MDAFNGDSIPVHLLTREAMALYLSHLRGPDSVIVVNATNVFVNLIPVVAELAENCGMKAKLILSDVETGVFRRNVFILLTRGNSLDVPEIQKAGYPIRDPLRATGRPQLWTDDYSNVVTLLVQ